MEQLSDTTLVERRGWRKQLGLVLGLSFVAPVVAPATIIVTGDFYNSDTGTDPAFWTTGGDSGVSGSIGENVNSTGSLTVDGGSLLQTRNGTLGAAAGSTGTAVVTGAGSVWSSSGVFVGSQGFGSLEVLDGGKVVATGNAYLGSSEGGSGQVTISGAGSEFESTRILRVGFRDSATLEVRDGAKLTTRTARIGQTSLSSTGSVLVTGAGTVWNNAIDSTVSFSLEGSQLTIADQALVQTGKIQLTSTFTDGNSKLIFDQGKLEARSFWADRDDISGQGTIETEGILGRGHDLDLVFDGTDVVNFSLTEGGDNLSVELTATGGGDWRAGSLTVRNGAQVKFISGYFDDANNKGSGGLTVTGVGSTWTNTSTFDLGGTDGREMRVEAGGQVFSNRADIAGDEGTSGSVVVTGADSTWTIENRLELGRSGVGILTIADNGLVIADETIVGQNDTSAGSKVVLDNGTLRTYELEANRNELSGQGSIEVSSIYGSSDSMLDFNGSHISTAILTGGGDNIALTVTTDGSGALGFGNLMIRNGANVDTATGGVGVGMGETSTATVTGQGTIWTPSSLIVGESGTGHLVVGDGAKVSTGRSTVGFRTGSIGTVKVSGVGTLWEAGNLDLGYEGRGELLIENGAQVTSGSLLVGDFLGSSGSIMVTGAGSKLTSSGVLQVGNTGEGLLTIEKGGTVTSDKLWTNGQPGTSKVLVTDADSSLNITRDFRLGWSRPSELEVKNGAKVSNDEAHVGYFGTGEGMATVTGAGSTWTTHSDLYLGYAGKGILTVEDGGKVQSRNSYLGNHINATGTATVTGAGSTWTTDSALYVGKQGQGTLKVENGGKANVGSSYLGDEVGSEGTVTVTGSGSTWTTDSALYVGNSGQGTLKVENGGKANVGSSYLGDEVGSEGTVTVTGSGSTFTTSSTFRVGNLGEGTMNVENGGKYLGNASIIVGVGEGSSGIVTVTGPGSAWESTANLWVGEEGEGTLTVSDGGTMTSRTGIFGNKEGSQGTVTVEGAGSSWDLGFGSFFVGVSGDGNLTVQNGAQISSGSGWIGSEVTGVGQVTVQGTDALWDNDSILAVGEHGHGTLNVKSGGKVETMDVRVGQEVGSTGHVVVNGAGSTLEVTEELTVGEDGFGDLKIQNGGTVNSDSGSIALMSTSATSSATVQGTGSTWNLTNSLVIGTYGRGSLTIKDGGRVNVGAYTFVDRFGEASGSRLALENGTLQTSTLWANRADVSGQGNLITNGVAGAGYNYTLEFNGTNTATATLTENSDNLNVTVTADGTGRLGSGNMLMRNGANVQSTWGHVGYGAGDDHQAIVSGAGTTWENSARIVVGEGGKGLLVVKDGAKVITGALDVGYETSGDGRVEVSGPGSSLEGNLFIGQRGNAYLVAKDGATLTSTIARVQTSSGSQAVATLSGTGTSWTISNDFQIGNKGDNRVEVLDGAQLTSYSGEIGRGTGSQGAMLVSGAGSKWVNDHDADFGVWGKAHLRIEDGGQVEIGRNLRVSDYDSGSTEITVTGQNSRLSVADNFRLGAGGAASLMIENEGTVFGQSVYIGHSDDNSEVIATTVTGEGSSLEATYSLVVGLTGTGSLEVRDGANVSNQSSSIGANTGSRGMAVVTGEGSTWVNSDLLRVGVNGTGTLTIADGGYVSAGDDISVNDASAVNLYVSNTPGGGTDGALLESTGGNIENNGTIMIYASGGSNAGTYTPMAAAGEIINNGEIMGLGGVVNADHTFTVSDVMAFTELDGDDVAGGRVQFDFEPNLIASFGTGATNVTLSALENAIESIHGNFVLDAYDFTNASAALGDYVLLSYFIGEGFDLDDLSIWHSVDGLAWTLFTPDSLSYDNGWVNFLVSGFSSYALTVVPEPSSASLLLLAAGGALLRRRKKSTR